MKPIIVEAADLAATFSLVMRHDTHYFRRHDLPEFVSALAHGFMPFSKHFLRLRSGDYIPKSLYSDKETRFVYLTIGQFSGERVDLTDLTFLDEAAGDEYGDRAIKRDSLIITRSGTVGVCHVFLLSPQEQEAAAKVASGDTSVEEEPEVEPCKIYIPSHHLAVVELPEDDRDKLEFLRLFLQSDFARAYFWAFASGKGQKEISNWSIRTLPIPNTPDPGALTQQALALEEEIERLREQIRCRLDDKRQIITAAVAGPGAQPGRDAAATSLEVAT